MEEDREGRASFVMHPSNALFPSAISTNEMPSDHTSLFSSAFPSRTSGAMYRDATWPVSLREQECSNGVVKPKSPSLMTPDSAISKLSGCTS